jgi:hypothetical protein
LLEFAKHNIECERKAMNTNDEVPNSPEAKVEQTTEAPTTSPETVEAAEDTAAPVAIDAEGTEASTDATASTESGANASEQIAQQVKDFANKLLKQLQTSFSGEQKPFVLIGLIVLASILLVILASKVLNFIDSLPLLEPVLKLVGLGYTVWFVYRYLIFAQSRKELVDSVKGFKSKIFGGS